MVRMNGISLGVIDRAQAHGPALYGKRELERALRAHGVDCVSVAHWSRSEGRRVVVIGTLADRLVRRLLGIGHAAPEAAFLRCIPRQSLSARAAPEQDLVVVAGSDDRGLMYALLELGERVEALGIAAIEELEPFDDQPELRVRGVDRYILGHLDLPWFHSRAFWNDFLGRLAHCRFNRFTLIMGYDTAFLTPPYPFFVEVPGYPDVIAVTPSERDKNLAALCDIGSCCHDHGLEFFLGTWQQTPWTEAQRVLVRGLPADEPGLAEYCASGMTALLNTCTTADGVQLRVNFEAGVGTQVSNDAFWRRIVTAVAAADRRVALDLRAKGLSDDLIEFALASGLDISVPTKHWCEHTGLPYHLSRMRTEELDRLGNLNHSRRYSYADLLKKPMAFDVIYRLWTYGSTCLFAWGDPDFARRFAESCRLGGTGFEIDAALSLRGGHEMLQGDPWSVYSDASLRSPGSEDDRYWYRYLSYGRLGYSTKTPPEVWRRQLSARFGAAAPPLEAGYSAASKILPLITAAHMPAHPSQWYWPEMSTGGALFEANQYNRRFGHSTYGRAEPSDAGLFYGIDEYVADRAGARVRAKYTPRQVASWLKQLAIDVTDALARAESAAALGDHLEYRQTALDFRMLADLARYHAWKISAALWWSQHSLSGAAEELARAYACMCAARDAWASLSERGAAFHHNLEFGFYIDTDRHGHWRDRLPELDQDLAQLLRGLDERSAPPTQDAIAAVQADEDRENPARWIDTPRIDVSWPERVRAHSELSVTVRVPQSTALGSKPVLRYRHTNQLEGEFLSLPLEPSQDAYHATIPAAYVTGEWDLLVYVASIDDERAAIFPGLFHPSYPAPYHVVRVTS